jgi:hypothetical protein
MLVAEESEMSKKLIFISHISDEAELARALTAQRFDIIHLVLAVDPASGDFLFSAVDQHVLPIDERPGRMRAEAFAGLLQEVQTRLVVLAKDVAFGSEAKQSSRGCDFAIAS